MVMALNNLKWLMCLKTKPNQTKLIELFDIELFDHLTVWKQMTDVLIELLVIHGNTWNHLTLLTYAKGNC